MPDYRLPLRYLTDLFEDLSVTVVAILRGNEVIVPRDGSVKCSKAIRFISFVMKNT